MFWTSCRVNGGHTHSEVKGEEEAHPIGGARPRRTWSGIIREVMALVCVGGEPGIGPGAVTHWFPSRWPPVLFPPRLQRLELVKCLGCTDLNSSYSPQKTLALPNQPFFSIPIVFLCNEHTLCLCIKVPSCAWGSYFKKRKVTLFPAAMPLSITARNNDRSFSFGRETCCG